METCSLACRFRRLLLLAVPQMSGSKFSPVGAIIGVTCLSGARPGDRRYLTGFGCFGGGPRNKRADQMKIPGFTAEMSIYGPTNQYRLFASRPFPALQVVAQACTTTCRNVIHPELCFFVPFPFCLFPQHECNTLCGP